MLAKASQDCNWARTPPSSVLLLLLGVSSESGGCRIRAVMGDDVALIVSTNLAATLRMVFLAEKANARVDLPEAV